MIDTEKVLAQLTLLAGLEEAEARRWLPLCQGAAGWVAGRLRRGVDATANEDALLTESGQPGVRVADLHLTPENSRGVQGAKALCEQLLAQAAHCLMPQEAPALLGVDAL